MVDQEWFTVKGKPVTYIEAFVKFYNWRNRRQVHEIHGMIELERIRALTIENPRNLGTHWMVEISSVLHSAYLLPRNQDRFVFYVNNYINWDEFNQLYDFDWIEKGIRNTDAVTCKLRLISTRATNQRIKVAREERQKTEEILERRKIKAMTAKCQRARGGIS